MVKLHAKWCDAASGLGAIAQRLGRGGLDPDPRGFLRRVRLKPSFGRVPFWPTPDIWAARAHNGPIARTVADAALLLSALAGPDARDPLSIDAPPEDYAAAVRNPLPALRGLRVAWSMNFGYAALDPEVRRLTTSAAERFASLGAHVESVDPGWDDPREAANPIKNCNEKDALRENSWSPQCSRTFLLL